MSFLRSLPAEFLNYISFLILGTILISLQTSLWMHLFGFFPAPYLWVPILCYWAITRNLIRGFIMTYLLSVVLFTFTGLSLEIIFATSFSVYFLIYLLRDRIMWKGHSYFSLTCFIASVSHPLFVVAYSYLLDPRPVKQFLFWDWLLSPLLTSLVAILLFNFLTWFDRLSLGKAMEDPETEFI